MARMVGGRCPTRSRAAWPAATFSPFERRRRDRVVELFLHASGRDRRAEPRSGDLQHVRSDQAHLSLDRSAVQETGPADRRSRSPIRFLRAIPTSTTRKRRATSSAFKPDPIYLKDQGGLLTVDRARTLLPVMMRNADGVPVDLHSHCTTGLRRLVYLEALAWGCGRAHGYPSARQRLVAALGPQRCEECPADGSFNQIDEKTVRVGFGAAHSDRKSRKICRSARRWNTTTRNTFIRCRAA